MDALKHDITVEFDVEQNIREILSDGKESPSIFDRLLLRFENYSSRAAPTIGDIKRRDNKRAKGLGWEKFCVFYLKNVLQYYQVWMWNEIPDDVRKYLKLGSKVDNGIDLVARQFNTNNNFVAVQCKYRKKIEQTVTWTMLSTFVGLCAQTGPWEKHIVMTNCKGVSRKTGIPKTIKDQTIAYGTFKNLTRAQCTLNALDQPSSYQSLINSNGQSINNGNNKDSNNDKEGNKVNPEEFMAMLNKPKTVEELRAARLAKFNQ